MFFFALVAATVANGKTINSLDELSNDKTYSIRCQSGEGYICYAPQFTEDYLYVCGAEEYVFTDGGSIAENLLVPFDAKNPNNLWQIVNDGENYYLYNVGVKKFAKMVTGSTGKTYGFVSAPTAIFVSENGDGTFGFNTTGNQYEYLCVSNRNNEEPVRWWTVDDHGSIMVVEEAEYPADDVLASMNLAGQFADALAAAKAQYEAGSNYFMSENLFTDPSQFYSEWTESSEGSVAGACDGDPDSFWHSAWSGGNVAPGTHDFYITLPEAVGGEMQFAMTRRNQAINDHILAFDVYASSKTSHNATDYEFVGTVNTPFASNTETVKGAFTVPEGTVSVRFVIAKTDLDRGYGHFAEFQLYARVLDPACFNAQNPNAAAAFAEAIAKAESVEHPTLADVEALQAAIAAYEAGDPLVASIRLNDTDLYFSTTEVPDNSVTTYSLAAEPEYFTFTATEDGGYVLQSTSTGKYVGHGVISSWDFSDDVSTWYIADLEGNPTTILKNASQGFGVDNAEAGKGVYTDKSGQYWVIEAKTALPKPDSFVYVEAVPENGATVEELSVITLTFSDAVQIVPAAQTFNGAVVMNSKGEEVTITSFEYDEANPNVVNIVLAEPITKFGKYSITVPEMFVWNSKANFEADDMGLSRGAVYNPEFTLEYMVAKNPLPEVGKYYFIRTENFGITSTTVYVGSGETPVYTPMAWLCSKDEAGKYVFTNNDGETLHFRGWAEGGTTWEITPMYMLKNSDMNQNSLPEEYVKPEVVVMRGYHKDGRFLYLNVNLSTGNYDHGANLFAPWNSSYTSFFVFEEVTEWSGDPEEIEFIPATEVTEAADLMNDFKVEFPCASSVEPSAFGLIGGVYDETGDIVGIIFSGEDYDLFGSAYAGRSNISLDFAPVGANATAAAANVIKRVADYAQPVAGEVSVYFCPKSFKVDGNTVDWTLSASYQVSGGGTTGIEGINAENKKAEIFDLQGRRVAVPVKGNLYIQNGQKVLK